MDDLAAILQTAVAAAEAAGRVLASQRAEFDVIHAAGKDLKTTADLAAEQEIFRRLDPLGFSTLSEETRSGTQVLGQGTHWIVDPLDGTVNYMRGISLYCVSIALWKDGQPVLGVIHEPTLQRTFAGIVGRGATCNGRPMQAATGNDPAQAVLCTGFPTGRSYSQESLLGFVGRVQRFKKVRLLGSAAVCLAYVAAGIVDAYFEEDIWLWDVAAGIALVQAAGGQTRFGPWNEQLKSRVVATNAGLSPDVIS